MFSWCVLHRVISVRWILDDSLPIVEMMTDCSVAVRYGHDAIFQWYWLEPQTIKVWAHFKVWFVSVLPFHYLPSTPNRLVGTCYLCPQSQYRCLGDICDVIFLSFTCFLYSSCCIAYLRAILRKPNGQMDYKLGIYGTSEHHFINWRLTPFQAQVVTIFAMISILNAQMRCKSAQLLAGIAHLETLL